MPPEVIRRRLSFAEPIGAREGLSRVVARLCVDLCGELAAKALGARRLDLVFGRVDRAAQAVQVKTARPNRDAAHLARLFGDRLDIIDPGFGIEHALLIASRVEPLTPKQTSARGLDQGEPETDLGNLVDRLATRLGEAQVYRQAPVESDLPERCVAKVPALAPAAGLTWPAALQRPTRLLDPPEPIEVVALVPDYPPAAFVWRRVRRRVVRADGPERVFGEWWRTDDERSAVARLLPARGCGWEPLLGFPGRPGGRRRAVVPARALRMSYAELQVTTHFSFLRGASSAEELFAAAAMLGIPALGVVDRNSLAGIVRAHEAAKVTGVRLVVGCRLDLEDGTALLVYPTDRAAYGRLCRLLSIGKGRAGKGACRLAWEDVAEWGEGQIAVLAPGRIDKGLAGRLRRLKSDFGGRAYCALTRRFRPNDALRLFKLEELARAARVPTVATNDVLYHAPERRMLQDVVTCIREGCTIDNAGFRRERFADRFLKPPAEMARLFERHPEAVARTIEIAERCTFSLV